MRKLCLVFAVAILGASLPVASALAQVPEGEPTDLPFFSDETPRGSGEAVPVAGPPPTAKTVDGNISDWVGLSSMYGGTIVYSGGELIYQDHIFDAHGPDDGRDASRFEKTDPLEEAYPGAYRIDAMAQADAPGQLGAPTPEQLQYGESYGDANDHQDRSDLLEVRAALSGSDLALLARTTTMTAANDTALLVLADTLPGTTAHTVPFDSGLTTSTGDVALFIANGTVQVADLTTGVTTAVPGGSAVADPNGWHNALEASVPLAALSAPDGSLSLAIASGKPNASNGGFAALSIETNDTTPHANVANVAFRLDEPSRTWFEQKQALSLFDKTIDPFFLNIDTAALSSGASQEWVPGAGYHDRIFYSDPSTDVPQERGRDGVYQHYGVFLPSSYDGTEAALQWWLHWRGGSAHTGAGVVPKIFKQYGEDRDAIVVSPSGRGTSTWYVGRGHLDFRQVWADVFDTFAIDDDHVYVTGHSMGGWGSYLLTLLYPDRFAAAAPVAGPVTQGAWTGADFSGCDSMKYDEYTPCYISANESRPRDQHTRKLLENARHVPYAILQGTSDELVPYSGVFRQHERLVQLGYRHRLFTYPGYEHFTHPAIDQWAEAASYLHRFTRPANPSHVTYKRDMPFERATEEVQSGGVKLNFDFNSAYWMSGLTPVDLTLGVASFDGRSLAIPEDPYVVAPDTGAPTAPGQTGPYIVTGVQWLDDLTKSTPAAANAFSVNLTGTSEVRLDLLRMAIDPADSIAGAVTTDHVLSLSLDADWTTAPNVAVDGQPVAVQLTDGVATVSVPSGTHNLTITPGATTPEEDVTGVSFTDRSDDAAQYSDTATLEARLTDSGGAPLADEEVAFSLGSSSASGTTDADGVATVTFPLNDAPGDYNAMVSFAGRAGELTPAVSTAPFTVMKEDSETTLTVSGKGSKRTLTATLADADASTSPLAGQTIVFRANGTQIGTATTNESGVATLAAPAGYRGGDITFRADYEGNGFYTASGDSKSV